jgi:hypothetical protein
MDGKIQPRKLRKKTTTEALRRQETEQMNSQPPILPLSLVSIGPIYSSSCASTPHDPALEASVNDGQIMVTNSVSVNERVGDASELVYEMA